MPKGVDKKLFRNQLDELVAKYKEQAGDVLTYAPQPAPDRQAWRKRPSLIDLAYQSDLQKIKQQGVVGDEKQK